MIFAGEVAKISGMFMNKEYFCRSALLLGDDALECLSRSRVAVFGIGGVGGFVCEGLARSSIGAFDLIDCDTVSESNINRQIIALESTIGRLKTEVMKERILQINSAAKVRVFNMFFLPENADEFHFEQYDYVVDALDTVSAKVSLAVKAQEEGVPLISSMGAGNKLDAGRFKVCDIYETKVCPLAKVMRRELRRRGVKSLKVVCSDEEPHHRQPNDSAAQKEKDDFASQEKSSARREKAVPGSVAFVPAVAGLLIAGEVVKDLIARATSQGNRFLRKELCPSSS